VEVGYAHGGNEQVNKDMAKYVCLHRYQIATDESISLANSDTWM